MSTDRIKKRLELEAPPSRVWQALTDYRQFGEWFRVAIESAFVVGEISRGHITWPGYEHLEWNAVIQSMQPETYFAFTWHPYAVEPGIDYSTETPTLVEFRLEQTDTGTLLSVSESGFDSLPQSRRDKAFRMNEGGWGQQLDNIAIYVSETR